jgi:hypothetical protein
VCAVRTGRFDIAPRHVLTTADHGILCDRLDLPWSKRHQLCHGAAKAGSTPRCAAQFRRFRIESVSRKDAEIPGHGKSRQSAVERGRSGAGNASPIAHHIETLNTRLKICIHPGYPPASGLVEQMLCAQQPGNIRRGCQAVADD